MLSLSGTLSLQQGQRLRQVSGLGRVRFFEFSTGLTQKPGKNTPALQRGPSGPGLRRGLYAIWGKVARHGFQSHHNWPPVCITGESHAAMRRRVIMMLPAPVATPSGNPLWQPPVAQPATCRRSEVRPIARSRAVLPVSTKRPHYAMKPPGHRPISVRRACTDQLHRLTQISFTGLHRSASQEGHRS